ncbi:MAG: caspase family protein [Planctomycetes bacterium]|nr:caspase family protein [Planctomycetota bacterium]MCW8137178.1 caspase family protein [Planctomycetota bacterium]
MKLTFRQLGPDAQPQAGEVIVLPPMSGAGASGAAFSEGLAAFRRGTGEPQTLVLPANPTLDDMLAAAILEARVEGKELPTALDGYARYAALVREGLRPGSAELAASPEGIFLAIRNAHGVQLKEHVAAKFEHDARRMCKHLLACAAAGKDPFKDALFSDSPDFARERAFLAKDRDVYTQDVARGEKWLVKLPGGPPAASALILRQPKSLLWKFWSREDKDSPTGDMYLLLGVELADQSWSFSVDPVQRLSLQELHGKLQAAELAANPAAKDDPWFDGARFNYTLVAAPRAGSKLTSDEILRIAREWLQAKKPSVKKAAAGVSPLMMAGMAAAVAVVAIGMFFGISALTGNDPAEPSPPVAAANKPAEVDFRARGLALKPNQLSQLRSEGVEIPGYALIVAVGLSSRGALPAACSDAGLVYGMLRDKFGYAPENMRVLVDEPDRTLDWTGRKVPVNGMPTRANMSRMLAELSEQTRRYPKGDRTNFVFYYAGHGETIERADTIGYLCLTDFWEKRDEKTPDIYGYNMGHLARDIRQNIKSSHQLMLVDCCFSGFVTKTRGDPKSDPSAIYEMWKSHAHVVMTAGTEGQVVYEKGKHSMFSGALFRALGMEGGSLIADTNGDGIVTDGELGAFIPAEVERKLAGTGKVQTPQYLRGLEDLDDVGQFLFVPR